MPSRVSVRAAGAVAALALVAACSRLPTGYGKESEEVFMRRCVAGGGAHATDICTCAYDRIVKDIPYSDYKKYDNQMRTNATLVPAPLEKIAADCAADATATTTSSTSSSTSSSTTSTTRSTTSTTSAP